jgi:ferrous iron transport protein A
MPLAIVQAGRRVRLVAVNAGHGLRGRLGSMGLVPGVEIEVLRNSMHGPFIIEVKGSRIMLGRGMAQKIIVE